MESSNEHPGFKQGTVLRFIHPQPEEENLLFVVLENRAPRVLVVEAGSVHAPIPPTFVYLAEDMEEVV